MFNIKQDNSNNSSSGKNAFFDLLSIFTTKHKLQPKKEALKIASIYGVVGVLWILLSDKILSLMITDISIFHIIQTLKGWLFVFASAILIFVLINDRLRLLKKAFSSISAGYEELSATHEELIAVEEELRKQYSELEQNRDALQVSKERYQLVVESANDGIWDWDIVNDQILFSTKWKSMLGYEDWEIENSIAIWEELLHPADKSFAVAELNNYFDSKDIIYQNIYRLRGKDGNYKSIFSRGIALRNDAGKILRFAGSHTDITEQIELQGKLKQEKDFSEQILNNSSIIILVWELDGTIIKFNRFGEKITGFTKDELLGKSWLQTLIPKQDIAFFQQVFDSFKKGEKIKEIEAKILCKNQKQINVLWNNSVLLTDDQQVRGVISLGTDITERKTVEKQMYNLAYYDNLTGLPNRALFEKQFHGILKDNNNNNIIALLYIDIDNFKNINDTLGHTAGDALLKNFSEVLLKAFTDSNIVARLSGDEFVVLLPNEVNDAGIVKKITKLQNMLNRPWNVENYEFFVTISIGIALYPEHGENTIRLLTSADTAMFHAKEKGKNRYFFFTTEMQEKLIAYIDLDKQLRYAIKNQEFVLYYQPLIDLRTGKIIGVEALIRWFHPHKGMIPPLDFIPFAEESGQITQIDEWVFATVWEQNLKWLAAGYEDLIISINISGKSLTSTNLLTNIIAAHKCLATTSSNIQLEITETVLMSDLAPTLSLLKELKLAGVKIALDDFGTGYSSLNYLKQLPIDVIKMDKSFIQSLTSKSKEEAIARAVMQLAHDMELKLVAEGIETKEQLEFLQAYSCDIGQGYLFSKPVPVAEIDKILKASILFEI